MQKGDGTLRIVATLKNWPDKPFFSELKQVFSRVLRDSIPSFVRRSVDRLVGPLFTFLAFLRFMGIRLLPR